MTLFNAKGANQQPKEGFSVKKFFENKGNIDGNIVVKERIGVEVFHRKGLRRNHYS